MQHKAFEAFQFTNTIFTGMDVTPILRKRTQYI